MPLSGGVNSAASVSAEIGETHEGQHREGAEVRESPGSLELTEIIIVGVAWTVQLPVNQAVNSDTDVSRALQ